MIGKLVKLGAAVWLALATLLISLPLDPDTHAACGESKWRLNLGESRSFSFTLQDDRPCEFDGDIRIDRFNTVVESNEANNTTRATHLC